MGKIFEIQTLKANVIKSLIEALRGIFKETSIEITKKGITLCDMNQDMTIMADMILESDEFDLYKLYDEIE